MPRKNFYPTVLEFPLFYVNKDFRNWLIKTNTDPLAQDFVDELERTGGDASLPNLSPYVTSKFNRFINDTTLRNILSQESTSFDFDDIMNSGEILIVKLNKGRFGSAVSALLANQIVSRFKNAAMKRGNMPPEERKPFSLYIDEAHAIPGDNLMPLLSEARKFKLGLVLVRNMPHNLPSSAAKTICFLQSSGMLGQLFFSESGKKMPRNYIQSSNLILVLWTF